ncbi:bifunctional N-acetylglucosamine-1-phosphate uridyltransferase/glucosamine-1-phosphate acetyltransferase [bacterium]|nr:bifunctional N-acetylglucosamine-1-phosphate uridyltransferase/glucosamine-1-phosphate acetyltransferase [bacterium]
MTNEINAVILAAGKGTRMKSDKSKVLHEIFGKTLLGYVLDAINKTQIIKNSYVIVGHQADAVTEFVTKNYDNAQTVLQSPQLGTGHAVSMVCPCLENFDGEVLILCGDTPLVTSETIKKFIKYHKNQNSDITVMSAIFDNPSNYGRIIRNGENLAAIVEEKDATTLQKEIKEFNAGIYCINWSKVKSAFSELKNNNAQGEYYLTDIISWGVSKGLNTNVYTIEDNSEIFGINSKIHLAQATSMLNQKILQKHLENGVTIVDTNSVWISQDTEIGADTVIFPNVYITGKNKIGNNCKIGPFAHLRGNVEIENNVKIGNFVEVKNSKISSNTNACHLTYIGDSEIGSGVNIGAGTITANYNHFTKKKSKTVIKDGSSIGSNSVLVAPVTIGEKCSIGAGSVITKDVEDKALALTRAALRTVENYIK